MSGIQSLVVLALLVIAGLVLVQNQMPIAVVFVGITSPMLPIGLWAILAAAVGSVTMLVVSLLLSWSALRRSRPGVRQVPASRSPDRRPRRDTPPEDMPPEAGGEVWDDDAAWSDRDRRESQFELNLEPPEPWELLDEPSIEPPVNRTESPARKPGESGESGKSREPLDLPPSSRYETPQEPVSVYRKGSVYSFSYAKPPDDDRPESTPNANPEAVSPRLTKENRDTGNSINDRVPLDLPTRDRIPLDALEEVTPIIEPVEPAKSVKSVETSDRPTPPRQSITPDDRRDQRRDQQRNEPPRRRPLRRSPPRRSPPPDPNDWNTPTDDSDWV